MSVLLTLAVCWTGIGLSRWLPVPLCLLLLALGLELLTRRREPASLPPLEGLELLRGAWLGAPLWAGAGLSAWSLHGGDSLTLSWIRASSLPFLAPRLEWGAGLLLVLAQERWFRGRLLGELGALKSSVLWWLALAPLDPLRGLSTGLLLALASRRSLSCALGARLTWWLLPAALAPGLGVLACAALLLASAWVMRGPERTARLELA